MVGNVGVTVWALVRYEIWLLRALLIFAQIDMRSGFSSYAFITDACLSGYGNGGGYIGTSGIRNMFDYDERWRFNEHAEDRETHRERALRQKHDNAKSIAVVAAADPLSDPIAAAAVIGTTARNLPVDPAFPDIPLSTIHSAAWKPLYAVPLTISEPVHLCEARLIRVP